MQNPFPYGENNKRYRTWSSYLKQTFGGKVGKAALDGGFTCPNIDGTKGIGGCIYCSGRGSGDFAPDAGVSISHQYQMQREVLQRKWPGAKSIAYFQAHSGTYAPLSQLREKYAQALALPDVVGLCIATRPDTLEDEVVEYLAELSRGTWVMVELGLQTVHDSTARLINRCHSWEDFLAGFHKLKAAGIPTCVHIINGLPGETEEMMLETARQVAVLHPHSIKIHMLYVLEDTPIAGIYKNGAFTLLDKGGFIGLVIQQLELLPADIVIQRLTGDPPRDSLLAPVWVTDKRGTLNGIDKEMRRQDTWQGRLAEKSDGKGT